MDQVTERVNAGQKPYYVERYANPVKWAFPIQGKYGGKEPGEDTNTACPTVTERSWPRSLARKQMMMPPALAR